jgi:hypothetical protein
MRRIEFIGMVGAAIDPLQHSSHLRQSNDACIAASF